MKRKLPVLIAIVFVLIIGLSACNYKIVPVTEGNEIASSHHSGRYGVEKGFDRWEYASVIGRGAQG